MNVNIGCYSSGVSKTDRGGTLKRLLLHTTPHLKEPGKARRPFQFPSALGSVLEKPPPLPHTPLGQIRYYPQVWAELLQIGQSLIASQFSFWMKSQVSHAALLWTLRAHRGMWDLRLLLGNKLRILFNLKPQKWISNLSPSWLRARAYSIHHTMGLSHSNHELCTNAVC